MNTIQLLTYYLLIYVPRAFDPSPVLPDGNENVPGRDQINNGGAFILAILLFLAFILSIIGIALTLLRAALSDRYTLNDAKKPVIVMIAVVLFSAVIGVIVTVAGGFGSALTGG